MLLGDVGQLLDPMTDKHVPQTGETVDYLGRVTIHGPLNVPSELPIHASEMYAKNLFNLVSPFITDEGELELDLDDEVIAGCVLTHGGDIKAEQYK